MQPLIVVPANDIDAAGMDLTVELPQSWLDSKLEDAEATSRSPGSFKGRLSRSGRADIVVRGDVRADLDMPCARCLAPAHVEVRAEMGLLLQPRPGGAPSEDASAKPRPNRTKGPKASATGNAKAKTTQDSRAKSQAAGREYEFGAHEADLDEYDGEKVVLDEFVREAILLELPSFPLCKEDCAGTPDGRLIPAAPASDKGEPPAKSPFAALRHLLSDGSAPLEETQGSARSPSPADLRRINRAKNRAKPKIRSSALGRGKKS